MADREKEASMKNVRFIGILFGIAFLPVLPLTAYTVSFVVVETGLPQGYPTAEASKFWEAGLLDVFFNAGHIVSNAPIARVQEDLDGSMFIPDIQGEYNEAVDGGAQFFILVLLDYTGKDYTGNRNMIPRPQAISIRLFGTNPYRFFLEQKYPGGRTTPIGDELIVAKDAARRLVPQVR